MAVNRAIHNIRMLYVSQLVDEAESESSDVEANDAAVDIQKTIRDLLSS
jgi:hypothetical protein